MARAHIDSVIVDDNLSIENGLNRVGLLLSKTIKGAAKAVLLAACLFVFMIHLAGCSFSSESPEQKGTNSADWLSGFVDAELCGLTIQMDPALIYDPDHSSGLYFHQYVYHFAGNDLVSQMVFRDMPLSEALAKTFGSQGVDEDELIDEGKISIGSLFADVTSCGNANGDFVFVYAKGDDGYGFALGFRGKSGSSNEVNEELIQYILETADFEVGKAIESIPPDDGKVEVLFSDGGIGPDGIPKGASAIKRERVEVGGSATPPEDPSAPGYLFMGWEGSYTNVQADTSVIAKWEEIGSIEIGFTLSAEAKEDLVGFANSFVEKQLGYKGGHDFVHPESPDEYDFYNLGHGNGMAPEGSEQYQVVGYVDMIDRDGKSLRKKYWIKIDYTMMDGNCHLDESKIGYDEE